MAALHELSNSESIRLDVSANSWQQAIQAAGDLLVATGVSNDSYTQAMVHNVEQHGPYIVIAPGFAFPHARAQGNVHHTGMSWVRLREPVSFGHPSNDPVTLLAALAAPDASAHLQGMRQLATLLSDPDTRQELDDAATPENFHAILRAASVEAAAPRNTNDDAGGAPSLSNADSTAAQASSQKTKNHILTVCGNGLGTSLFLKNTLEKVLDEWGWSPYLSVEATDTISAKGKSKDADLILTSGEIARTLGDVGIPVKVIANFTSTQEIDAALRDSYDV
ncbi:PTS sugar transporter subunit IIA [Kocuria sp.]|uniref:PTS sugar transporter subunit IIA n=1 Tax=Kocuria sp. TaxID=1871328 RepID=UPI0026E071E7|nr:PTS sugar transporter subunit IIA [Kocuria sp.]MDO5618070.1 PTS sugar transporter subunit IIA [Kocuria sp.]